MVVASPAAPPFGSWQPGFGTPAVVHVAFLGGLVPARPRAAVGRLGFASLAKTIRAVQRCLSADQPVRGMNRASPDWGKRRQTAMGLWLAAALTVSGVASCLVYSGW